MSYVSLNLVCFFVQAEDVKELVTKEVVEKCGKCVHMLGVSCCPLALFESCTSLYIYPSVHTVNVPRDGSTYCVSVFVWL